MSSSANACPLWQCSTNRSLQSSVDDYEYDVSKEYIYLEDVPRTCTPVECCHHLLKKRAQGHHKRQALEGNAMFAELERNN